MAPTIEGGKPVKIHIYNETTKKWEGWDGVLGVGDIEIGAVEIKDHDGTDRLEITSANAAKTDNVSATGFNGGPVTVGTSQVELTFTGVTKSILIQSDQDNTGKIWLGATGVTNTGGNAIVQLEAGGSVSMDLNDASATLYAISDTASQNVHKVALT